jgi:hypothetical protein
MCVFPEDTLRCERCGYVAKRVNTFRLCRTLPEIAVQYATEQHQQRIKVPPLKIGSAVSAALSSMGITPELVSAVAGKDCGCKQRANALDAAGTAISKTVERAANAVANALFPSGVDPNDVQQMTTALLESDAINPGLKRINAEGTNGQTAEPG